MVRFAYPKQELLRQQCRSGEEVLVSAPFYSAESLAWVVPAANGRLEFWTRLNPNDFVAGVSDPAALVKLVDCLGAGRVTLRMHRALHAKIYLVDRKWGYVGSANLTLAAFFTNVEAMAEMDGEEAEALAHLVDIMRPRLQEVSVDDFRSFVDATKDVIEKYPEHRQLVPEEAQGELQAAIDLADDLLVPRKPEIDHERAPRLEDFIVFLERRNESSAGELIARHRGHSNLQGHVKQSYYGSVLFLLHPAYASLRPGLVQTAVNHVPRVSREVEEKWIEFLDAHAGIKGPDFDLSVLRRILPESLGGYTTTGGGASSTFRRTLPLVARFLDEHKIE
ncbi:phospholipase D family protein [Limnochorda pilosa]|uniref:PLD phosphodiesterase domain-containing protein n=1 Tax=Limnochorda pilosa TaxID=1555112 RepID=A0A0K2SQT8_LIMPI|nr:phospholipase D family protein [Limnochorda pilosa]BAS29372.1 hypothetical protein LIP_3561 [Limnochorda pilosa]